tara:strand:+ start:20696 stop:21322 length:627 start_codon:yes stop_codon:yes gene_type:complete
MIDKVKMLCEQYQEPRDTFKDNFSETPISFGRKKQRERIYSICDYATKNNPGDIIQIGCKDGELTKLFCEIAQKYDRTVTCIDPFITVNRTEKTSENYFKFLMNTAPYSDIVHLHMEETSSELSDALMQLVEYSFVYISGLNKYDVHANEIDLCSVKNHNSGIICLDNIRKDGKKKDKSMLDLYQDKLNQYSFGYYWNQGQREGYLLP